MASSLEELPSYQSAAWIEEPGPAGRVVIRKDVPVRTPGEGEVLVKVEYTGICHSDIRNVLGWGVYKDIPGHEGVGKVVRIGQHVSESLLNQRVGIKWLYNACGSCSVCVEKHENNCSSQLNTGRSVDGTLQQYMIADAKYVTRIPDGVPSEIAAPLLCAGLSMAGAVSKLDNELKAGDWVVIPGAGGGLGHIGVQIAARVKKYKVIAVDTGDAKRSLTSELGAVAFVDFATEDVVARVKELTGGEGANGIIVVAGSEKAYEIAPKLIRNTGVLVCVGLPRNDFQIPISPIECANRGLIIKGSSTGNEKQMDELLQLAIEKIVLPQISIREFSDTGDIIEKLKKDEISGRVVVKIPH